MKGLYIAARIVLFIFAVVGILKAVGVFSGQASGPSAHICLKDEVDLNGARCITDQSVVRARDLSTDLVSVETGTNSGADYNTIRVTISRKDAAGTYNDIGSSDVDLGDEYLMNNVYAVKLHEVIDNAGITLVPGTTYRLTMENLPSDDAVGDSTDDNLGFGYDDGAVAKPLGTVDFTYKS
jgi:hypothetical protein